MLPHPQVFKTRATGLGYHGDMTPERSSDK